MNTDTCLRLNAAQIEHAFELLETEYDRAKVSRVARMLFLTLQLVAFLLPPWIAAYLVARRLGDDFAGWAFGLQSWIPPLVVSLVVLLILNAALIKKAWRQFRLARKMRALDILDDRQSGRSDAGWWTQLRTVLILAAPLGLLAMALRALGSEQASIGERAVVLAICVGLPISLLLFDRLLERLRKRIAYFREVAAVRRGLGPSETDAGDLKLPEELARRLDDIESVRILRRREEAIRRAGRRSGRDYFVAKHSTVRDACRKLDGRRRALVEEALEALAAAPHEGLTASAEGGVRSWNVLGTALTLRYTLDASTRRIDVVSLIPSDAE